jgi:hypothetical protein
MSVLRAVGRAVRDGWLLLGATLLLFIGLELGYRAFRGIRSDAPPRPAVDSSLHPYAGQEWWGPFQGADGRWPGATGTTPIALTGRSPLPPGT